MNAAAVWIAAASLWAGCLVPGPWWLLLGGAGMAGVAAMNWPKAVRLVLIALALTALGSGGAGGRVALQERGPPVELAQQGGAAVVIATVVSDAKATDHGAWLLVRVSEVGGQPVRQRAAVRLAGAEGAPAFGSVVTFPATARPLERDDFDGFLRQMYAATLLSPTAPISVVRGPTLPIRSTNVVRANVRAASRQHLDADRAALLAGLVVGDTTGLSTTAQDVLRTAGLSHLVAVSGSNVAIVLAGTVAIAALARLGARGRRRVAVVALLWFVVLVRFEPSVLRAAAMALLVLLASATGRGVHARHTLGVGVMILLLADPFLARQLGFVLSVLATGGVLAGGPAIAARLPGPRWAATLVGATVGAQLGVAPVLLVMEGGLPLGALPANLIAVPAAALASAVGIVAAAGAQWSVAFGGLIAVLAGPPLAVIEWSGNTFADVVALRPEHLLTPAAVAVVAAVMLRRRAPRTAVIAIALVVVVTVGPWQHGGTVEVLTLTALDVGQGDAMLVEVPPAPGIAAARMLVDAGPDEREAVRALRQRGITSLDVVVASHPHADHTNGLPGVLTQVRVDAFVVGPRPAQELDEPATSALAAEVVATQEGVPLIRAGAGQRFALGAATVEILSPSAHSSLGPEPNDNSLVLRVSMADGSLLLTGDVEVAAQQRLLARPDLVQADVLKVPHHGGATNAEGFLDAVGAHTAVIGVGKDNDYGHPHPDVLADLAGIRILRTDTAGTVSVAVD